MSFVKRTINTNILKDYFKNQGYNALEQYVINADAIILSDELSGEVLSIVGDKDLSIDEKNNMVKKLLNNE